MKMPFPGMDPYLEHPVLWPSVHTRLMVALASQLRPHIRPRYVASVEERVYLEGTEEQRVPDVGVHRIRQNGAPPLTTSAVMDTPLVVEVEGQEVHEHYIDILDRQQDMRVVTTIEVVSPSNKAAGPGREAYVRKQRETCASETHLVEIDLLRPGRHVLSVPEMRVRELTEYKYLASVNRASARTRFEVYPRQRRERLPRLRIPLSEPDGDVPLDVQAALEQVYEDGDYMLRVRYDEPCVPPLAGEDQQWANECWTAYKAAHPELFPPPAGTSSTSEAAS